MLIFSRKCVVFIVNQSACNKLYSAVVDFKDIKFYFVLTKTYSVSYQMSIFQQDLNWPNESGHFLWNRGCRESRTNKYSLLYTHRVFQEQIIIVTMICLQCIFTFNFHHHHHHHSMYVRVYVFKVAVHKVGAMQEVIGLQRT